MGDDHILSEQIAYYRARAGEYDEWFLREGRYDRGPEHRAAWFGEVATVEAALASEHPHGAVLELACGTGIWTQRLAQTAERVTAVDASPEVITLNRERLKGKAVDYIQTDLFSWTPPSTYDFVFFSFWLSHVPRERLDAFWKMVKQALRPGGKAFFVDSLFTPESTAKDHAPLTDSGVVRRKLNDGREFDIVKVFHEPADLQAELQGAGWNGYVRSSWRFFLYGCVLPEKSE